MYHNFFSMEYKKMMLVTFSTLLSLASGASPSIESDAAGGIVITAESVMFSGLRTEKGKELLLSELVNDVRSKATADTVSATVDDVVKEMTVKNDATSVRTLGLYRIYLLFA
jgi:hypothetical protein